MEWIIQYRIKGNTQILTEVVDVSFTDKRKVQEWWKGKNMTFVDCIGNKTIGGYREDKEFVNCKPKQR